MNILRRAIPTIIARITGKERYLPVIEWSSKSWTHNVFRVYEMICGKRWGITTEAWTGEVSVEVNGRMRNVIVHEFYTAEATIAHFETNVREFLSKLKNFDFEFHLPYKLYVYKLQPTNGAPMEMGVLGTPYVFAIAIDATTAVSATNSVSTKSFSHTCTGSDRILWGALGCSTSTLSSSTYNSVSLTRASQVNLQSSWAELWYLVAPATGSNTLVINTAGSNSITGGVFSFTGASQTGQPDATHADSSQTGSVTSYSHSITTVADNCMIVMSGRANGGLTLTGGTNTTASQPEVAALGMFMARSTNPITPAGSATLTVTSSAQQFFSVVASFKPVAGTAYTTERTETVTNTDTLVKSVTRSISETVTNTDTFIKNTLRTISESVTGTDTFSYVMIFYKELSETVTSVDSIIRDVVRNISETVTNNDVINKITARIVSETTTIADTITNMQVKLIILYENLTLIEDFRMFLNSRVARWRDKYNESKTQDWVEKQDL